MSATLAELPAWLAVDWVSVHGELGRAGLTGSALVMLELVKLMNLRLEQRVNYIQESSFDQKRSTVLHNTHTLFYRKGSKVGGAWQDV